MVAADCNSESDESLKLASEEHVVALPIPNTTRRRSSSSEDKCATCVACSCLLGVPLLLIGCLCIYFIGTSLKSDKVLDPTNFRIGDVNTVSVSVNQFNNSVDGAVNYLVSGQWNMTLILNNPNPTLPIRYTHLHARLWYKSRDHDVASTHLPPFTHQHMGETRVSLQFTAVKQYVDDDVATHIINGDDDGLKFGVTLFLMYRIQRNNYFIKDDEFKSDDPIEDCYPLLSNPITDNSSNLPSTSNSTSIPCIRFLDTYYSSRCGDFYFI